MLRFAVRGPSRTLSLACTRALGALVQWVSYIDDAHRLDFAPCKDELEFVLRLQLKHAHGLAFSLVTEVGTGGGERESVRKSWGRWMRGMCNCTTFFGPPMRSCPLHHLSMLLTAIIWTQMQLAPIILAVTFKSTPRTMAPSAIS